MCSYAGSWCLEPCPFLPLGIGSCFSSLNVSGEQEVVITPQQYVVPELILSLHFEGLPCILHPASQTAIR